MVSEKNLKEGVVYLVKAPFTDKSLFKIRPALLLFREYDNYIFLGVTSNLNMSGVKLSKKDGLLKNSVVKLNYVFTIPLEYIVENVCVLSKLKREEIYNNFITKLNNFKK